MTVKPIQLGIAILALVLALARVVLWFLPPSSASLPTSRHVILLLVPDLSEQSLKDEKNTPTLKAVADHSIVGALKIKPRESFSLACKRISTGIRGGVELLKDQGVNRVLVGHEEGLPVVGADGVVPLAEEWSKPDPDSPDGHATDVERFVGILTSTLRQPGNVPSTFIVGIFDDLYRARRYAPLTMPGVAEEQHQVALHRLDALLAALTGSDGIPDDATLIVAAPIAPESDAFGPVLLWKRTGISDRPVLPTEAHSVPGVLTASSLLPMTFTILNVTASAKSNHTVSLVPTTTDDPLPPQTRALTMRQANHRYLRFVIVFLYILALIVGFLKWVHHPRPAKALGAVILATPLFLYGLGIVSTHFAGELYAWSLLGDTIVFLALYWTPPDKVGLLYRILSVATLLIFVVDAVIGSRLAMASPLTDRSGSIAVWGGAAWGTLIGALLLCLHPLLLQLRWWALIAWTIALVVSFLLGGILATLVVILFAFGVVVPREFATLLREAHSSMEFRTDNEM